MGFFKKLFKVVAIVAAVVAVVYTAGLAASALAPAGSFMAELGLAVTTGIEAAASAVATGFSELASSLGIGVTEATAQTAAAVSTAAETAPALATTAAEATGTGLLQTAAPALSLESPAAMAIDAAVKAPIAEIGTGFAGSATTAAAPAAGGVSQTAALGSAADKVASLSTSPSADALVKAAGGEVTKTGGGLWDKAAQFAKDSPLAAGALMQGISGAAQGALADGAEEKLRAEEESDERNRERMRDNTVGLEVNLPNVRQPGAQDLRRRVDPRNRLARPLDGMLARLNPKLAGG